MATSRTQTDRKRLSLCPPQEQTFSCPSVTSVVETERTYSRTPWLSGSGLYFDSGMSIDTIAEEVLRFPVLSSFQEATKEAPKDLRKRQGIENIGNRSWRDHDQIHWQAERLLHLPAQAHLHERSRAPHLTRCQRGRPAPHDCRCNRPHRQSGLGLKLTIQGIRSVCSQNP